ncbi:hypothetical protein PMAYCL1PPCAC_26862, partial [Pristionchus mayeri]
WQNFEKLINSMSERAGIVEGLFGQNLDLMTSKVVVSSDSKLLSISLMNDRCSMKYSEDESTIFVDPPDDCYVSTIDLS